MKHSSYFIALALLLPVLVTSPSGPSEARVRRASAMLTLDMVRWEVTHVLSRLDRLFAAVGPDQRGLSEAERGLVKRFFMTPTQGERQALLSSVEAVLERALATVLRRQAVAPPIPFVPQSVVFPPVSLAISEPPKLAVVSPRRRIEIVRTVFLLPELDWPRAERLEAAIDNQEEVSLVTPIGGLSTYPTLVLNSKDARPVLESAAHEWVHAYLFFTPLGQHYWADYQARTINESAAELTGRELGQHLAEELGFEPWQDHSRQPSVRTGFDLRAEMRTTRIEVERLLDVGLVEDAETYMRRRQAVFAQHGYAMRKLNQAYFAFHGTYAQDGAAGSSPIAQRLQQLRRQSRSLAEFLQRVGQIRGARDLAEAV